MICGVKLNVAQTSESAGFNCCNFISLFVHWNGFIFTVAVSVNAVASSIIEWLMPGTHQWLLEEEKNTFKNVTSGILTETFNEFAGCLTNCSAPWCWALAWILEEEFYCCVYAEDVQTSKRNLEWCFYHLCRAVFDLEMSVCVVKAKDSGQQHNK